MSIQGWANFEPPKTVVKRMVVEEHQKVAVSKSSFSTDKQQFSPHKLEGSALAYLNNNTTPSAFLYSSRDKGNCIGTTQMVSRCVHLSALRLLAYPIKKDLP